MRRLFSAGFLLAVLSACAPITVAGNGSDSKGGPITSSFTQKILDANTFNLALQIITARGNVCVANQDLTKGQTIWMLNLKCQDGTSGTATFTADYINARDTVIYRLANGEQGRLIYGASLLQTIQG